MSDGIKAFWLGVFIIITVAVAAWLLLFLKPSVGDCGTVLKVRFANIQNVSIGTRVTFAGKPVGEVIKINTIPNARANPPTSAGDIYFYELDLCVDSSVEIYNYDDILFSTSGLLGEKSISIIPKAAPPGEPAPHEVTDDILYARSVDSLEETLVKIGDVADVFESAMTRINEFLDANMEEFHDSLVNISEAAGTFNTFLDQLNKENFTAKAVEAAESIAGAMRRADVFLKDLNDSELIRKLSNGQGTLGRLLNSDSFYLQMQAVMCKLETVLGDISNYGLLFQYDRSWQRKRIAKENQIKQMCSPAQAAAFFNEEMCEINNNLERVERFLNCTCCPSEDPCVAEAFRELLGRVEHLQCTLKNYNEMMFEEYCRRRY